MLRGVAGPGIGREDGRASALEVLLPLKRGGRVWLVLWLGLLRTSRPLRQRAFRELDELRFVYAIRWTLVPPFERARRPWMLRPEDRWQLLFQSNFDGDWDEYLENFASVMPKGLASLVWVGSGYTGLTSPDLFKRYAKAHDHLPEHYASAYVDLTAGDIRREIADRYGRGAAKAIHQGGYSEEALSWTNLVLPLRADRTGPAVRAARAMEPPCVGDEEPTPLLLLSGAVHFARVVVLQLPTGSWLMITLTHDGKARPILADALRRDREGDAEHPEPVLGPLLSHVLGVPHPDSPAWDDDRVLELLLAHRPRTRRHSLAYCAYPGFTVADIRALDAAPSRHDRYPSGDEQVS